MLVENVARRYNEIQKTQQTGGGENPRQCGDGSVQNDGETEEEKCQQADGKDPLEFQSLLICFLMFLKRNHREQHQLMGEVSCPESSSSQD